MRRILEAIHDLHEYYKEHGTFFAEGFNAQKFRFHVSICGICGMIALIVAYGIGNDNAIFEGIVVFFVCSLVKSFNKILEKKKPKCIVHLGLSSFESHISFDWKNCCEES